MEKDNTLKEKIREFLTKGRPDDFKGIFAFRDDKGYDIGYIGEDKKPFPIPSGLIGSEEIRKNADIFEEVMNEPKMKLLIEEENPLKEKIREFLTKGRPDDFKGTFAFKDDRGYEIGYIGEDKKSFPISSGLIGSEETRKNADIFEEVMNEPKMKLLIQKNEVLQRIKNSKTTYETNSINKPKFN